MLDKKNSSMQLKNYNIYFFFGMLILVSVITFYIFKPFLIALLLAAILAISFNRLYKKLLSFTRNRKRLSSLIASLSILLLIIIPLIMIFLLVGNEVVASYQSMSKTGDFYQKYANPVAERIQESTLLKNLGLQELLSKEAFSKYSGQLGQLSLLFLQNVYVNVAHIGFMIFVMFFSLYYFFIDGEFLVGKIMQISPIKNSNEKLLAQKFVSMSNATIKGTFIVALVQGLIGGIAFYIVGIQSVVVWGVFMSVLSLLPMLGSSLVWIPAAVILLLGGHIWQGIFILAVGFAIISLIDNILRPALVGKDTQMHPLMVLLATLGGLSLFGISGFIIGPIIVALFVSMWEIYGNEFKSQLKKYNS